MSEGLKSAGVYNLVSFTVSNLSDNASPVDISTLIHTWEIRESIKSGSVRGSAKVYDATGFLQGFPLRGQELIEVVYKDYRDVELTEKFVLYAISNVKPFGSGDNGIEYTISFVSVGKFVSEKYEIRRCIAEGFGSGRIYKPVSEQAEILFRDYFKGDELGTDKDLYITDTDGPQKLIIPALRPEDAMHFLTRKAWSAELKSQEYRFFETREQYYFTCIEDLIFENSNKPALFYYYNTGPADTGPEAELEKMQNILSYSFDNYSNSHDAMLNGAYYRQTNELNILERTEVVNDYEHLERYADNLYPDVGGEIGFMHTNEFVEEHLNRNHRTYVFRDYPGADDSPTVRQRPATYYPDIYNNKGAQTYHYGSTRMNIRIFGNNNVFPGRTMKVELPIQSTDNQLDNSRSGMYLVESVNNLFYEQSYYQDLTLIKGGILPFTETG